MVPARHRISAVALLAPGCRAGYRGRDHHQGKRRARDRVLVLLRRGIERSVVVDASLLRVDSVPSPQGGAGKEDDEDDDVDVRCRLAAAASPPPPSAPLAAIDPAKCEVQRTTSHHTVLK